MWQEKTSPSKQPLMALVIFSQIERNARAHVQSMVYCIWGLGIHILNMSGPKKVLKSIHFEKATKFCEIFPLLLTSVHTVKSKGKISQNVLAFSEYMNFNIYLSIARDRSCFFHRFSSGFVFCDIIIIQYSMYSIILSFRLLCSLLYLLICTSYSVFGEKKTSGKH